MSIAAIIIALVLAFLAFKFVTGIIKFVVIGAIVLAAIYFLSQGTFA
jgi:hypothetical protein